MSLRKKDQLLASLIAHEAKRQKETIELIASENYVSKEVLEANASILTNKYAEGYPGKRYYGGCQYIDLIEQLAIDRACVLFGSKYANVQPHSGSQANMAAYDALVQPGDTVLAMDLTHGGHLTHGSTVNFSGTKYNFVHYGVNNHGFIDYDNVLELAQKHKPKLIVAGASAYPREIRFDKFREIADIVNAKLLVDMSHIAGLVVAGAHQSPVPYADIVTTTTHKTLRGPRGGIILTNSEPLSKKINSAIFPGSQGGPLEHTIAAKAVCFKEAMQPSFTEYINNVCDNTMMLAHSLRAFGFNLVSGGSDNHLILIDLTKQNITGKEAQEILDKIGISTNKNTIPNETRSPFITSGLRIGTAAITTRGFKENELLDIALQFKTVLNREFIDTVEEEELRAQRKRNARVYRKYSVYAK